jgi:hypothetical protein
MTEKTTCPKCRHQHPSRDETGLLIPQCPACGIYYFKYLNQQSNLPQRPSAELAQIPPPRPVHTDTERLLAYQELATHKTNHILHFLLSLATAGFWIIFWFLISASNTGERNKIRKKYGLPVENDIAGAILKFLLTIFVITLIFRALR